MAARTRTKIKGEGFEESSGNVFLDLGFPPQEAENLLLRAELISRVRELIRRRKLTQAQAARILHVSQPRISDLMRGKIHLFSIDALLTMLGHAGIQAEIRLKPKAA